MVDWPVFHDRLWAGVVTAEVRYTLPLALKAVLSQTNRRWY